MCYTKVSEDNMEQKRKIVSEILGRYVRKGNEHLYHCPYCKHHKKENVCEFCTRRIQMLVLGHKEQKHIQVVRKFGNHNQRQKWQT